MHHFATADLAYYARELKSICPAVFLYSPSGRFRQYYIIWYACRSMASLSNHLSPARRGNNGGFTLTELAIVIGITGLIVAAIWVAGSMVNERMKINQAVDEFQTVSHDMIALYQGRPLPTPCTSPSNDMTDNAISANLIPSWAVVPVVPCSQATNPWGTQFSVFAAISPIPFPVNGFYLVFGAIPLDACIALMLQGTSCDPTQTGCPNMVEGAGGLLPAPAAGGWQTVMTPAEAVTLCTPPGHAVVIAYFIYKL
jgi:Prokaryotic N-terminal methylation motif